MARPSKLTDEFVAQVEKIARLGATDEEMAEIFGVTTRTFNNWKKKPAFLQALTRGKVFADANVADALYQRALGYSHPDVHVSQYKGKVITTEIIKHFPPDTMAAMYWLNNRQRKLFQKNPQFEKGAEEPIPTKVVFEVVDGRKKG